jgi:hypothetical protein
MSKLSQETIDRIKTDAISWSENQYGHDDVNKDYLEGALHEVGRAQGLVDAFVIISKAPMPTNDSERESWVIAARATVVDALAKYKEVSNE